MKITLINPASPFLLNQRVNPPLGILYLASVLKKRGFPVNILDANGRSDIDGFLKKQITAASDSEIFGISYTTAQVKEAKHILKLIRQYKKNTRVIAGGPHATVVGARLLDEGFDSIVIGEGEEAILRVLDDILQQKPKKIYQEPHIEKIDDIPFPARELIDLDSYHFRVEGLRMASIMTSRGCPYRCTYCSCIAVWGNNVRFHSIDYVMKEIEAIFQQYPFYQGVWFNDDTFTLPNARFYGLLGELKRMNIPWRCFARAKPLSEKIVRLMKKSGCVEVLIGVESGSSKILKMLNKKTTVSDNYNACRLFKKYDIKVKALFMIGLPGETEKTLQETLDFIENAKPDKLDLSLFVPLPGTEIYNHPEKFNMSFEREYIIQRGAFYKSRYMTYRDYKSCSSFLTAQRIFNWREKVIEKFQMHQKTPR